MASSPHPFIYKVGRCILADASLAKNIQTPQHCFLGAWGGHVLKQTVEGEVSKNNTFFWTGVYGKTKQLEQSSRTGRLPYRYLFLAKKKEGARVSDICIVRDWEHGQSLTIIRRIFPNDVVDV